MFARSLLFVILIGVSVIAAPSNSSVGVVPLEKSQPEIIQILSQSEDLEANGTYSFSYETGNGIKREETAFEKVLPPVARSAHHDHHDEDSHDDDYDNNSEIHVQRGSYSYTSPDGTIISLRYVADENGFQPEGDHLPKAPTVSNSEEVKSGNHISKNAQHKPDNESAASEHKETKAAAPALLSRSATDDEDSAVTESASKEKDEAVTDINDFSATEPETKVKTEEDLKSELTEPGVNTESTERTTDLPSTTEISETPITLESTQSTTETTEVDLVNESEVTTQAGNAEKSTKDSATESKSLSTEVTSTVAST